MPNYTAISGTLDLIDAPTMPSPSRKLFPVYPRPTFGCLACRKSARICDETKPRCIVCNYQGLSCTWPNGRNLASTTRNASHCRRTTLNTGHKATPISIGPARQVFLLDSQQPLRLTTASTHLLRYYISVTAWQLPAISGSRNPFIQSVLPAAKDNNTLMHAILAVSGAHLAYNASDPGPIEIATRQHYSGAIRGVRYAVVSQALSKSDPLLLLIIALLCRYEVC